MRKRMEGNEERNTNYSQDKLMNLEMIYKIMYTKLDQWRDPKPTGEGTDRHRVY